MFLIGMAANDELPMDMTQFDETQLHIFIEGYKSPILNIDWPLLREQKLSLLQMQDGMTTKENNVIDGIINLIDSLQDYAVDELGVNPEDVYMKGDTDES